MRIGLKLVVSVINETKQVSFQTKHGSGEILVRS